MDIKRLLSLIMTVFVILSLCGCDLITSNTEELLTPPELTGEFRLIKEALESSVDTQITLKYPSGGEHRSPVILRDIDSDGTEEAFAFYSTSNTELTSMNLSVIKYNKKTKSWQAFDRQTITGSGVEKVEFCDLDDDGTEEILVGWEIYAASEKQLAVYSVTKKALSQRMMEQYTTFVSCDLDENGKTEILLQYLDAATAKNTAALIKLDKSGVLRYGECILDGNVKTVNPPIVSTLSNGKPAVYYDENKGIGAITEVVYLLKGELVNPLFDKEADENILTLRDSVLFSTDINSDGILEIPISSHLENADITSNEKLYYTRWCSYNGENLTEMKLSVVNTADSYRLDIPQKWFGKISISKNTEKRERVIYEYSTETAETGKKIVTIRAVSRSDFDSGRGFNKKKAIRIYESDTFVYLAFIPDQTQNSIKVTEKELKNMFIPVQF